MKFKHNLLLIIICALLLSGCFGKKRHILPQISDTTDVISFFDQVIANNHGDYSFYVGQHNGSFHFPVDDDLQKSTTLYGIYTPLFLRGSLFQNLETFCKSRYKNAIFNYGNDYKAPLNKNYVEDKWGIDKRLYREIDSLNYRFIPLAKFDQLKFDLFNQDITGITMKNAGVNSKFRAQQVCYTWNNGYPDIKFVSTGYTNLTSDSSYSFIAINSDTKYLNDLVNKNVSAIKSMESKISDLKNDAANYEFKGVFKGLETSINLKPSNNKYLDDYILNIKIENNTQKPISIVPMPFGQAANVEGSAYGITYSSEKIYLSKCQIINEGKALINPTQTCSIDIPVVISAFKDKAEDITLISEEGDIKLKRKTKYEEICPSSCKQPFMYD
tara:strand:- start:290 stop:1447 length:1158 start_codon:yes stop_codon:yes gene_type:complete